MITQHVKPPIVITVPAPPRRRIPVSLLIFVLSVALLLFSSALTGDGEAVLAAVGCAGIIASIYRPTRVAASQRVYTVFGVRLHGDEETDKLFDEGRCNSRSIKYHEMKGRYRYAHRNNRETLCMARQDGIYDRNPT